jgi:alpha-1,3/alpha-1,6-mannosyltransferase
VTERPLRVAFLHPVLGIGGAERLVVDAALELAARGHAATIYTAAHDPAHAFPETRDGRLDVRVHGAFLPARVAGKLQAACTTARVAGLALAATLAREEYDVIVADVVPHALAVLRPLRAIHALPERTRLVYYCHYPDRLLAPSRGGPYRAYRAPLDALELRAMRAADLLLVNSRFTARAVARLGGPAGDVLYPGVDVATHARVPDLRGDESTVLALGRFDERKNLPLLIDALAALRERSPEAFARASLVIAGAQSLPEDARVAVALQEQARRLGVADKVTIIGSPSEDERRALLARCLCLVHAAPDEHFGIAPVEAMAAGRPVVAVADGGTLETVLDGQTGFLCAPTAPAFADALALLLDDPARAIALGRAARAHAATCFSRARFGDALEAKLQCLTEGARRP